MKTHHTTIDGVTYSAKTLPATQGLIVMPKLLAIFGEVLLKIVFAVDDDERDELIRDPATIAAFLGRMALNAAETNGLLVVKELFEGVEADKVKVGEVDVPGPVLAHFDNHFSARYGHLFQVAAWLAVLNFLGPSSAMLSHLTQRLQGQRDPTKESTAANGKSTTATRPGRL